MTTQFDIIKFHHFNYHIVGYVVEFLNDIEKYSYDTFSEEWWMDCFMKILHNKENLDPNDTQKILLTKILNKLPNQLINTEKLNRLLEIAVNEYFEHSENTTHLCGFRECDGNCGIQSCGVCIDCCRCYTYM
jgi:hypothetical protein